MKPITWKGKEYERSQERKALKNVEEHNTGGRSQSDSRLGKTGNKSGTGRASTLSTKELLRCMGAYFELDPKRVNFWIRQQELSGKL